MDSGVKLPTRPPSGVRMAGERVNPRSVMLIDAWVLVSCNDLLLLISGYPDTYDVNDLLALLAEFGCE